MVWLTEISLKLRKWVDGHAHVWADQKNVRAREHFSGPSARADHVRHACAVQSWASRLSEEGAAWIYFWTRQDFVFL